MHLLLGLTPDHDAAAALETTLERARAASDDLTVAVAGESTADLCEHVRDYLADVDADIDVRVLEGDPGSQFVELAATEGFDRIVIPGGTRSPMGKIRIDDTSEFVLLNAPMTVTFLR